AQASAMRAHSQSRRLTRVVSSATFSGPDQACATAEGARPPRFNAPARQRGLASSHCLDTLDQVRHAAHGVCSEMLRKAPRPAASVQTTSLVSAEGIEPSTY